MRSRSHARFTRQRVETARSSAAASRSASAVGAGLGDGHLRGHLLRGRVGLRAPLLSFGGALLGGGADGFHLGFGGGRVDDCLDGLAEPGGDVGDPVGFGALQAQQFSAGDPGNVTEVSVSAGLAAFPAAAAARRRHSLQAVTLVCPRPSQYSGGRPGPAAGAAGAVQPGCLHEVDLAGTCFVHVAT
jgi:hypothetical protein